MPRYLSILSTILLTLGLTSLAAASRVVVPTDVPTIQAAINGLADTIAVMDGVAPERLTVRRFVVLEPVAGGWPVGIWRTSPLVRSLQVLPADESSCCGTGITVRGMRFLGKVDASTLYASGGVVFESCRFDSGFVGPGAGTATTFINLSIHGCTFIGDVNLSGYLQFVGNTVIGGTLRVRADGNHDIRDNYVQGPAAAGMELNLQESGGVVSRNSVRGTVDGLRFLGNGTMSASENDIADCSGTGMDFHSGSLGGADCDSNSIARCSGVGILVRTDSPGANPGARMSGNIIRQTGLGGITIVNGIAYKARRNVILDAGGVGFTSFLADSFENNVIGRSHGAGVQIGESWHIASNTVFSSGGVGLDIQESLSGNQVTHNVSAFNGGPGLAFHGSHAPQLSCNDWFGNSGGQTVGLPPSYADISVNPRFCDLGGGDVHLSASSPLLADPNCGLIGALGQGCVGTTDVPETGPSPATVFRASPTPAPGAVSFTFPASIGLTKLEVFDVTGARRWECVISAGATHLEWDGRGIAGQRVSPGVYFARLRRNGASFPRVRMILTK